MNWNTTAKRRVRKRKDFSDGTGHFMSPTTNSDSISQGNGKQQRTTTNINDQVSVSSSFNFKPIATTSSGISNDGKKVSDDFT